MSLVHRSQGVLAPGLAPAAQRAGHRRRAGPGGAAGPHGLDGHVDWTALVDDYDRIRDHIAAVIPGFEDFNRRVRDPDGFVLPNAVRERRFPTASRPRPLHRVPDPAHHPGATASW